MYLIRSFWLVTILVGMVTLSSCVQDVAPVTEPENPSHARALDPAELADKGVAPELENDVWLNVPAPLRLADLQGKVVLLDFWTFG